MEIRCMILRTEIVNTSSRLAEVVAAWDALRRRGDQSVFQSHGLISAWCASRQTNDGSRLCVRLCWLGADLAAVMPFATRRHRDVRVLKWAAKDCCEAMVDFAPSALTVDRSW